MKKIVLGLMFAYSCYASMPWETGWAMGGTSTYFIFDKNNNQLLLECNDMNKNVYLKNERRDSFKFASTIKVKLDDKEINTLDGVDDETKSKDKFTWNDFINNLSKAKKISIYNNNKEYIFEPNNSDKIQDILDTCKINSQTEQAKDTTSANNNTSNTNATATFDSNKPPFRFSFEDAYDGKINKLHFPLLVFTSLKDQLIVKDIKINKGKCAMANPYEVKYDPNLRDYTTTPKRFPMTIKEFETVKFSVSSQCNILRVDIETNNGTWTFGEN